jgi:hypothetical protein
VAPEVEAELAAEVAAEVEAEEEVVVVHLLPLAVDMNNKGACTRSPSYMLLPSQRKIILLLELTLQFFS